MAPSRVRAGLGSVTVAALVTSGLIAIGQGPVSATHSTVTAVKGNAFGYWADEIILLGGPQADIGPTPTVALATDASNSPQNATADTGLVAYGPANLFTSDAINVTSTGSLGTTGSVTSTSDIQNVNYANTQPDRTGVEIFGYPPPEPPESPYINFNPDNLRTSVAGTATASELGVSGSATITNGMVRTHAQSSTDCVSGQGEIEGVPPWVTTQCGRADDKHTHDWFDPEGVVTIPTDPPPNYTVAGHLHLGYNTTDYFVIVFNEQISNVDGSITVNPVHEYFGTKLDANGNIVKDLSSLLHGHLYLGQIVAGVTTITRPPDLLNQPPVANNDVYTTQARTSLSVPAPGVLGNDTDADGDPLTAGSASDPANGAVTLAANGSFTYTPDADFAGTDSFTYVTSDGRDGTDTATVTMTVNAVNDGPVANDDAYSTNEDTMLSVAAPGVLGNDTDADGDPLTGGSASAPAHGSVTLSTDGSFTYAPAANYAGGDSFTYTANDGQGGSDTATVTIMVNPVNDAPDAVNDAYTTAANTPLSVAAPGVLGNDTDVDGHGLTSGSASDPAGGSVTVNADGSFTYTPDAGFSGTDTFTYTADDGNGGTDTATVTITVTAPPPPSSGPTTLAVADLWVAEGSGATTATFTVTRSGDTSGTTTLTHKTSGGTASAGTDYNAILAAPLTFNPGETSKPVQVAVNGDTVPEKAETFTLALSAPPKGTVLGDAVATATIVNDDGAAYVGASNVVVAESNSGSTQATFSVSRYGNTTGTSTVTAKISGGTATSGTDYAAFAPTTLTFGPGIDSQSVTVEVLGDAAAEANETFNLVLSTPSVGTTLGDASATAYIDDDDGATAAPASTFFAVNSVTLNEANSGTTQATFTVTRYGDKSTTQSVSYKTTNGTAIAGADFTGVTTGQVTFAAGDGEETITIDVAADTAPEKDETFNVVLFGAAKGTVLGDSSGTATLVNDDGFAYVAVANLLASEGNAGTTVFNVTVTRYGNSTDPVTVKAKTSGGTATAGSDYTAITETLLQFGVNETTKTVPVNVAGDTTAEPNETFNTVLFSPGLGVTLSDASGTATIVNDD